MEEKEFIEVLKQNPKVRGAYLREFGEPLKMFIYTKFGSLKKASFHLKCSKSALSQYWSKNSSKKPGRDVLERLRQWGLEQKYVDYLTNSAVDNSELLSYNEIKFLYLELKRTSELKDRYIKLLEEKVKSVNLPR